MNPDQIRFHLNSTPIAQITGTDIASLLEHRVPEDTSLDYKSASRDKHDRTRKDVVAMANAGGGTIVFGIATDANDLYPESIEGIDDAHALRNELFEVLRDSIEPALQSLTIGIVEVEIDSSKTELVVLRLDDEPNKPFSVRGQGNSRFFPVRRGPNRTHLSMTELRAMLRDDPLMIQINSIADYLASNPLPTPLRASELTPDGLLTTQDVEIASKYLRKQFVDTYSDRPWMRIAVLPIPLIDPSSLRPAEQELISLMNSPPGRRYGGYFISARADTSRIPTLGLCSVDKFYDYELRVYWNGIAEFYSSLDQRIARWGMDSQSFQDTPLNALIYTEPLVRMIQFAQALQEFFDTDSHRIELQFLHAQDTYVTFAHPNSPAFRFAASGDDIHGVFKKIPLEDIEIRSPDIGRLNLHECAAYDLIHEFYREVGFSQQEFKVQYFDEEGNFSID